MHHTDLTMIGMYDTPDRDPRARVVSAAYMAVLADMLAPVAGDDARDARWVPVAEALAARLAFDHRTILLDALRLAGVTC